MCGFFCLQLLDHCPHLIRAPSVTPAGSPLDALSLALVGIFVLLLEVKVAQSCPSLWDPVDYTVHGILQARILKWVAFPFSRGSSQPRDRTQVSHVARWILYQLSHRKAEEYWSGEPIPSPVDLPNPGTEQGLLHCKRILYQLGYQGSQCTPT